MAWEVKQYKGDPGSYINVLKRISVSNLPSKKTRWINPGEVLFVLKSEKDFRDEECQDDGNCLLRVVALYNAASVEFWIINKSYEEVLARLNV